VHNSTAVETFMKNSEKYLDKLKDKIRNINVNDFSGNHQTILYFIHESLVGSFFKTYLKNCGNSHNLRSFHDKLFTKLLHIRNPKVFFRQLPTFIATEFCEGITFFKNNSGKESIPFYHRDYSCGDKTKTATEKFVNAENDNKVHFLKNCYIERYIYDIIYTQVTHQQNIEHLHELKIIEQMYQDKHPNEKLKIFIDFDKDLTEPKTLTVMTEYIDKKYITTEIFMKQKHFTSCKKYDNKNNVYEKTQTYEQEEPWILQ
jgi:hypothetical protein